MCNITLKAKVKEYVKKQSVCFSLMVIAINPVSEGHEDGGRQQSLPQATAVYEQNQRVDKERISSSGHNDIIDQKILDYYKLGKLYLLQGQMGNSYNAFLMGENLEDMGALSHGNLLGTQGAMIASSLPQQGSSIGDDSLSDYLKNLVSLYLKRVEILSKNPIYLDEARREIEKIFIIDPQNKRAKELADEIKDKQKSLQAPSELKPLEKEVKKNVPLPEIILPKEKLDSPFIDEKERALATAEEKMKTSILQRSDMNKMESALMKHYDSGKINLKNKDYFNAIKEFKMVLAIDPEHLYSNYARKFIAAAKKKIQEREEHDLKLVQQEKIVKKESQGEDFISKTPFDEAVDTPQATLIKSTQNISSIDHLKIKREEILRAQFKNVLTSVRKFIHEGRYLAALENLDALLSIDPINKEAQILKLRAQQLLADKRQREREEIVSDIIRTKDEEEAKDSYFLKQKRKQEVRKEVKEKYKMAQENIKALLMIDPSNQEARNLELQLKDVLSEKKEKERIESNILRIKAEEEWRKKYFARQRKRLEARRNIEKKYKEWEDINQKTMKREVQNKIEAKLNDARYWLSVNDYFKTNKELETLSIISPVNKEADKIKQDLQNNIRQLASLLEDNKKEKINNINMRKSTVKKREKKFMPTHGSQINEGKRNKKDVKTVKKVDPQGAEDNGKTVFNKISNFRPVTLFDPQISSSQVKTPNVKESHERVVKANEQKEENIEITKPEVINQSNDIKVEDKNRVKKELQAKPLIQEEPSVKRSVVRVKKAIQEKQPKTVNKIVQKETNNINNNHVKRNESYDFELEKEILSPTSNEKQKLMKYLIRGKQHFRQGNYPLALVSFNKVKSLDKEQLFLSEVEELISATKRRLDSTQG